MNASHKNIWFFNITFELGCVVFYATKMTIHDLQTALYELITNPNMPACVKAMKALEELTPGELAVGDGCIEQLILAAIIVWGETEVLYSQFKGLAIGIFHTVVERFAAAGFPWAAIFRGRQAVMNSLKINSEQLESMYKSRNTTFRGDCIRPLVIKDIMKLLELAKLATAALATAEPATAEPATAAPATAALATATAAFANEWLECFIDASSTADIGTEYLEAFRKRAGVVIAQLNILGAVSVDWLAKAPMSEVRLYDVLSSLTLAHINALIISHYMGGELSPGTEPVAMAAYLGHQEIDDFIAGNPSRVMAVVNELESIQRAARAILGCK